MHLLRAAAESRLGKQTPGLQMRMSHAPASMSPGIRRTNLRQRPSSGTPATEGNQFPGALHAKSIGLSVRDHTGECPRAANQRPFQPQVWLGFHNFTGTSEGDAELMARLCEATSLGSTGYGPAVSHFGTCRPSVDCAASSRSQLRALGRPSEDGKRILAGGLRLKCSGMTSRGGPLLSGW